MDASAPIDPAQLRAALPRIMAYWRDWLRDTPDSQPRSGERGRRELALVTAVIDAAAAVRDGCPTPSALEVAARSYGGIARRKCVDPLELADEMALLRHAIWRCAKEQQPDDHEQLRFVAALDNTISFTVQATLAGAYCITLETTKATG
jgi:hypothetical protein